MKHAEVPAAIDLVVEEVGKESQRIRDAGGEALKAGKLKPAKEAIAYAEELAEFVKKIQKLGDEWQKLEAKIGSSTPEVKEIVLPTKQVKSRAGFKMKPGCRKSAKKSFSVYFADGTTIEGLKGRDVLAKTIEKIGPAEISKLGVLVDGEPLVSRSIKNYKNPSSAALIKDGWYVATHSSTKSKVSMVNKIAAKLGVNLKAGIA